MRRSTASDPIPLKTKLQPTQTRAQDTYEIVLATAGEMLRTIGFEQLTTNAICKRAGLTPPALYRYFPNKYAILHELGARLMTLQDNAVLAWLDGDHDGDGEGNGGLDGPTRTARLAKSIAIQKQIAAITLAFPGGAAIGRALRAVPMLQSLRFSSRDMVAERFYDAIRPRYPHASDERLRVAMRMLVELGYAASEMVVEEPDRDADLLIHEVCRMFALYFDSFADAPQKDET